MNGSEIYLTPPVTYQFTVVYCRQRLTSHMKQRRLHSRSMIAPSLALQVGQRRKDRSLNVRF